MVAANKAFKPTATLYPSSLVDGLYVLKALPPIATFLSPTVFEPRASLPIATFKSPVVI